jgi:hypothetical protein
MKPRLKSLSLTEEDLDAWWWGTVKRGRLFEVTKAFANVYVVADRRDAKLMLHSQVHRRFWHGPMTHGYLVDDERKLPLYTGGRLP